MPITVPQQAVLALSEPFVARVRVLLVKKAKATKVALINGTTVTQESKDLASRVMSDPPGIAAKIAHAVVSDTGIAGNALNGGGDDTDRTDAQLESIINTAFDSHVWDDVA